MTIHKETHLNINRKIQNDVFFVISWLAIRQIGTPAKQLNASFFFRHNLENSKPKGNKEPHSSPLLHIIVFDKWHIRDSHTLNDTFKDICSIRYSYFKIVHV